MQVRLAWFTVQPLPLREVAVNSEGSTLLTVTMPLDAPAPVLVTVMV